jgi:hypothetical protein
MVNLKVDKDSLIGAQLMLAAVGKSIDPIIYRAINKSIDNSQTKAVDEIGNVLNLTKFRIRQDFKKLKAYSNKLSGQLIAEGGPIGFMAFKPTQLKKGKGVSVKFKKKGAREVFRHAFVATGRGGVESVFEREEWGQAPWRPSYPYAKLPREHRFPLDRLHAASIEDYYKDPRIYNLVQFFAAVRLEHHTLDQAEFELGKI